MTLAMKPPLGMFALGTSYHAGRKPQQPTWGEATLGGAKALGPCPTHQPCEPAIVGAGPQVTVAPWFGWSRVEQNLKQKS